MSGPRTTSAICRRLRTENEIPYAKYLPQWEKSYIKRAAVPSSERRFGYVTNVISPVCGFPVPHSRQRTLLQHRHLVKSLAKSSLSTDRALPTRYANFGQRNQTFKYLFVLANRYCRTNTSDCHHSRMEQRTRKRQWEGRRQQVHSIKIIELRRNLWIIHALSESVLQLLSVYIFV